MRISKYKGAVSAHSRRLVTGTVHMQGFSPGGFNWSGSGSHEWLCMVWNDCFSIATLCIVRFSTMLNLHKREVIAHGFVDTRQCYCSMTWSALFASTVSRPVDAIYQPSACFLLGLRARFKTSPLLYHRINPRALGGEQTITISISWIMHRLIMYTSLIHTNEWHCVYDYTPCSTVNQCERAFNIVMQRK